MDWDVVIVGSGSGGAVVASRLTEDPKVRVLLLEAGPDLWPNPPDAVLRLRGGSGVGEFDWNYLDPKMKSALPRGRLVGGSSAVNASYALRGQPHDYDGWGPGWSWNEVLPYFNRLEDDQDFGDSPFHGRGGPIAIYRMQAQTTLEETFVASCHELGHEFLPDLNSPGAVGVGPLPRNIKDGVRQSTLVTYLAQARTRPNLTIRPDSTVDTLLFEGDRVVGVRLAGGEEVRAPRTVLAAGAYNTPQVLLRSGVGDAAQLARHGIEARLVLPEVGRHLTDHPLTVLVFELQGGSERDLVRVGPTVKFRSEPGLPIDDMKVTLFPDGEILTLPGLSGLHLEIDHTESTGVVELVSRDPHAAPYIEHRLLSHENDMARMVRGVKHALEIFRAMSGSVPIELLLPDLDTINDPELLMEHIRTFHSTGYHPSGTARIGQVVDQTCRLLGAEGLWIADASVMPQVPRANTNLPTLMIGERVSDFVRADL